MREPNGPVVEGRKAFKKSDLILVGALLVICLAVMGFWAWKKASSRGTGANYAVLTRDGAYLASFDLGRYEEHSVLDLSKEYSIPGKLEFQDGAVRFIEMDCPDKICESVGYVKDEMDGAICLPNRAALMVYTPEEYQNLMAQLEQQAK